ncbi:hypothetical protein [Duganella sp. CF458]|uniref:hypothetical protein n=1 Tax=Duganella sp. CF458 TaxID=1884368 RepID=UPI000B80552E|nr:hypothetical protein [Duganella sp. CF458]
MLALAVIAIAMSAFFFFRIEHAPVAPVGQPRDTHQKATAAIVHPTMPAPLQQPQDRLAFAIKVSGEFQSTRDLHALYMKFRDGADPNARYFALRAIDFCARFLVRSSSGAAFSTAPELLRGATDQQDLANRQLYARCAGFRNVPPSEIWASIRHLKTVVANESSNIAIAAKASDLLSMNKLEQAASLASSVLRSREPDAIAELEHYLQEVQDTRSKASGQSSDNNIDGLAIRLAACELGKDCSSTALEQQLLCMYGGGCDDSLAQRTARALPESAMLEVLRRRDDFVLAIKTGKLGVFGFD